MNTLKIHRAINHVLANYKKRLETLTDEEFIRTPPIGGWSISEVYSHIFDSSILSLMALRKAAVGKGKPAVTILAVRTILFLGFLPPGKKYQVPNRLMDRVKKITISEAIQTISDFERELNIAYQSIPTANPKIKVQHPRLGYLNASQWFRFVEIHLKHHLKQLQRIDKSWAKLASLR